MGNLDPQLTEEDVRREFSAYGDVKGVRIVTQGGRRTGTRCHADRHYGFVYFNSVDTAEKVRSILLEKPEWKGNIAFARKKKSGRSHAKRGSAD